MLRVSDPPTEEKRPEPGAALTTCAELVPAGQRIYLDQVSLPTLTTPEVLGGARRPKLSLVPNPTSSSQMHPIEAHFRSSRPDPLTESGFPM